MSGFLYICRAELYEFLNLFSISLSNAQFAQENICWGEAVRCQGLKSAQQVWSPH